MVESPHCVLVDPEWNPRVSSLLLRRSSRPPLIVVWTPVLCSWRLKKKESFSPQCPFCPLLRRAQHQ
jgi:hypothetical protein